MQNISLKFTFLRIYIHTWVHLHIKADLMVHQMSRIFTAHLKTLGYLLTFRQCPPVQNTAFLEQKKTWKVLKRYWNFWKRRKQKLAAARIIINIIFFIESWALSNAGNWFYTHPHPLLTLKQSQKMIWPNHNFSRNPYLQQFDSNFIIILCNLHHPAFSIVTILSETKPDNVTNCITFENIKLAQSFHNNRFSTPHMLSSCRNKAFFL